MELLQLQYFVESAKTENFSKVAARHFVPASSVSASVKKLEKELGVPLFDRSANKLSLNENGRLFFDAVSTALNLIVEAKDKLSPLRPAHAEKIRLLIRSERSLINKNILRFKRDFPCVSFHLTHSYAPHNLDDYDIIIDDLSGEYQGFSQKPLITEKIRIAAAADHPLRDQKLLLSELKPMPFITMSSGSSLNRITREFCHKAGFEPNIIIESDDPSYVRKYISDNFGIAFYPEKSWQDATTPDICFLHIIDFDYARTTYVYLNSTKRLSSAARCFFEYVGE